MTAPETDQLRITCHHEAGHVVAAVLRGGTVRTISITGSGAHLGFVDSAVQPWDRPFYFWAGPWAEARAQWPAVRPLDGDDAGWWEFVEVVEVARFLNPTDETNYRAARAAWPGAAAVADVEAEESVWHRELELLWPGVQAVAALLLAGVTVTHGIAEAAIAVTEEAS